MIRRLAYFAFIVLLVALIPSPVQSWLRNATISATAPVARLLIEKNQNLTNAWSNFKQIPDLRQQRTNLQQQVLDLQKQLVDQDTILSENAALRKELGVTGITHDMPKVLARVLLQGSDPFDRTISVDIGSKQGVKVGQPAVSQGILLGRVSEVGQDSSVIRLVTSTKSHIQVWLSATRDKGLLSGTGTSVTLTDIAQGVSVPQSSILETSGLGGSLPQGIQIGQTGSTLSKPSDLSQSFTVTLSVDPSSIESLFILTGDIHQ